MDNKGFFEVGDVLVGCWGYDACLYNFYEVVGQTKTMLKLRELKTRVVGDTKYPMYYGNLIAPITEGADRFEGDTFNRKPSYYQSGNQIHGYVSIKSYMTAHIWNGKPCDEYNAH